MTASHVLGRLGESVACRYLERQGLVVLARNWRCASGELDVVATDGVRLVVCEVKCRSGAGRGDPLEAATPEQLDRVRRTAYRWRREHRLSGVGVRVDLVGLEWPPGGPVRLRHVRGV